MPGRPLEPLSSLADMVRHDERLRGVLEQPNPFMAAEREPPWPGWEYVVYAAFAAIPVGIAWAMHGAWLASPVAAGLGAVIVAARPRGWFGDHRLLWRLLLYVAVAGVLAAVVDVAGGSREQLLLVPGVWFAAFAVLAPGLRAAGRWLSRRLAPVEPRNASSPGSIDDPW